MMINIPQPKVWSKEGDHAECPDGRCQEASQSKNNLALESHDISNFFFFCLQYGSGCFVKGQQDTEHQKCLVTNLHDWVLVFFSED